MSDERGEFNEPQREEIDLSGLSAKEQVIRKQQQRTMQNEDNIPNDVPREDAPRLKRGLAEDLSDKSNPSEILDSLLERDEDDFLPWEEITLPSLGNYYGDKIPGGVVRVRPMGIGVEKILATPRLAQSGQSLDKLFEKCVQFPAPDFDSTHLLAGDRIFLLYVIRGITHGNVYEFIMKCPECDHQFTTSYDLNELAKTIKRPNNSIGKEPFKVVLPFMSEKAGREIWVGIRFLRSYDVSRISQRHKFNKRAKSVAASPRQDRSRDEVVDESLTENLNLAIVSFMGEEVDPHKIKLLVDRMHSRDTSTIREFLRDNSPGIDTTIIVECPNCGHEIRTDLPITENFFRPAKS